MRKLYVTRLVAAPLLLLGLLTPVSAASQPPALMVSEALAPSLLDQDGNQQTRSASEVAPLTGP